MKKNTILIVSNDTEYIASIECTLATEISLDYSLEIITDSNYLEEYLKVPHKIAALIIEESMAKLFSSAQIVGKALFLTDRDDQPNMINKLDGAEIILRKLGTEFIKISSKAGTIDSKIIDVVSIAGGSGKTVTALGIARQLSKMRKKVLYIDAENMQTFRECLGGTDDKTFDVTKVDILMDPKNCKAADLESNILRDRFDYLAPLKGNLMRYQLSESNLQAYARRIAAENIYDYIVVEHGTSGNAEFYDYINGSSKIVVTTFQDKRCAGRMKTFLENTSQFMGQVVIVCNYFDESKDNSMQKIADECNIPVCERVELLDGNLTMNEIDNKGLFMQTAQAIM